MFVSLKQDLELHQLHTIFLTLYDTYWIALLILLFFSICQLITQSHLVNIYPLSLDVYECKHLHIQVHQYLSRQRTVNFNIEKHATKLVVI